MGAKRRICDICGKRKRFDADKWKREGWIELDAEAKRRACPYCAKKRALKVKELVHEPLDETSKG